MSVNPKRRPSSFHYRRRRAVAFRRRKSSARLFRPIRARDGDVALPILVADVHAPRIAADLAVLNEAAVHITFDKDVNMLTAVWALDDELFVHDGS